jgi:hypothetical protein
MAAMRRGDTVAARGYWWQSIREQAHWQGAAAFGLTLMPDTVAQALIRRFKPPFTH